MYKLSKHYANGKKPEIKSHILDDSLKIFRTDKSRETESRLVVGKV